MKRSLLLALAGGLASLSFATAPAPAASVPAGVLAAQGASKAPTVVEVRYRRDLRSHRFSHRHHWRHRHDYRFYPRYYWYPRYYGWGYMPYCGPQYTCWWTRYGYRACGWVDRCW
jgi:hypothetical protein